MSSLTDVYLGIGSNLGDREKNIDRALQALSESSGIIVDKVSSYINTKPLGGPSQPDFLNAVVRIKSFLPAKEILRIIQTIEVSMGRVRGVKNGPRVIDLDILLYGDQLVNEEGLEIPHPRMFERDFVLRPLFEIEPRLKKLCETLRLKK